MSDHDAALPPGEPVPAHAPGSTVARRLWELYEAVHDVVYFTPECREAASRAGLRGFWMGYFAFRAAPLGAVDAAPVTAMFYGFHPSRPERALPDAWRYCTPAAALDARATSAAAALRRICGPALDEAGRLTEVLDLAWRAAEATSIAGRPLGAANRALARPEDPVAALWQACTTLREHRGDGHVAVLTGHRIGPVQAHLLKTATTEGSDPDLLRDARGWPAPVWHQVTAELTAGGQLAGTGDPTASGRRRWAEVERLTDQLDHAPWAELEQGAVEDLADYLAPLAEAVHASGEFPRGNPTGLPGPGRSTARTARPGPP